jgi:hypothetical protein
MGTLFKNLVILSEDNTKLVQLKLDDVDITKHRTCDISYSQHTLVNNTQFPLMRTISINAQTKLDIGMEIKEFNFAYSERNLEIKSDNQIIYYAGPVKIEISG